MYEWRSYGDKERIASEEGSKAEDPIDGGAIIKKRGQNKKKLELLIGG